MRLNRAIIFVNDLDRMVAFYRDTLGLEVVEETREDTYVELDAGDARLGLHLIPEAQRCEADACAVPREKTPIKLSFAVDDAGSECKRLEALGVTVLRRPWGGYDGVDPEGNLFGISSVS